jgi:group I intron endonuclease
MLIYEIKNKLNGKSYIGQYGRDIKKFNEYWGSGKLIKAAIKKYGIENFEKNILEYCSSKKELDEKEVYWISNKNSIEDGYNLREGGTGGDTSNFIDYTDYEYIKNKSIAVKKYWDSLTDEQHQERSLKVSGENNGMFGKDGYWKGRKKPKELIEKSLENRRSYSGENNPNWRGGNKTITCSDCGIEISIKNKTKKCNKCRCRKGDKNTFFGKKHSEKSKKIMSEKRIGKKPTNVRRVKIDGVTYESLTDASKNTGIGSGLIIHRIKSKKEKYSGYEYV